MNWEALAVIGSFALLLGFVLYIPARWWARRQTNRPGDEKAGTERLAWMCEKCGGRKRLKFIRAPWLIVCTVVLVLLLLLAVRHVVANPVMQLLAIYIGGAIALAPALSTIRISCVDCEPQFEEERR